MSKHQHDKNAKELWGYFQAVINWIETIFTNYRKEMKVFESQKGICPKCGKHFEMEEMEADHINALARWRKNHIRELPNVMQRR